MKPQKKSNNPVIKSFEEFTQAVEFIHSGPDKGFGKGTSTYQFRESGYYIHSSTLEKVYLYYKEHNLWFDTETHTIDRINSR